MKQLVALFFLIVFSFQVVPVKALGRLIAKAQMTEEVKGSCDSDDDGGCADDNTKDSKDTKDEKEKDENAEKYNDLLHYERIHSDQLLAITGPQNKFTLWTSEDLIHLFTKDIHCPPPNC